MLNNAPKPTRRSSLVTLAGLCALGLAFLPACTVDKEPTDVENVGSTQLTWEQFLDMIYQEPDTGYWIVNGDEVITSERELEQLYLQFVEKGALIVHRAGGVDAVWSSSQKLNLTYCVSTTFGTNYNTVVAAMNNAAAAWEAAANVNFVHSSGQDSNCTASNNNVVFDVRPVNSGGQYLARAFFPNSARSSRNVLIDNTAFGNIPPWTLTGVLRHELGHALGWRHEHTRPESGTCFEDNSWRALTNYDSASVMHYPQCNGTQTGDLVLTQKDKDGAVSIYGAPGGGGTCEHDKCATGGKLTAAYCGSVVTAVCAADSYCCSTAWDSICVGEVYSIGNSMTCGGSCAHAPCTTGAMLTSSCNPSVTTICNVDPYCCNTAWDSICVGEVSSVAGKTCNQ